MHGEGYLEPTGCYIGVSDDRLEAGAPIPEAPFVTDDFSFGGAGKSAIKRDRHTDCSYPTAAGGGNKATYRLEHGKWHVTASAAGISFRPPTAAVDAWLGDDCTFSRSRGAFIIGDSEGGNVVTIFHVGVTSPNVATGIAIAEFPGVANNLTV